MMAQTGMKLTWSPASNVALYGQALVNQLNFNLGRILPHTTENVSIGYGIAS